MNFIELIIHTKTAQEKYLIEEKDNTFHISKYRRNFIGFWHYKKLAQAKSQEDALKIIHILTPDTILNTEVLHNQSFQGQWNWHWVWHVQEQPVVPPNPVGIPPYSWPWSREWTTT